MLVVADCILDPRGGQSMEENPGSTLTGDDTQLGAGRRPAF